MIQLTGAPAMATGSIAPAPEAAWQALNAEAETRPDDADLAYRQGMAAIDAAVRGVRDIEFPRWLRGGRGPERKPGRR